MVRALRALVLIVALVLAGAAPAIAAPKFPALTGRVVDDAEVLSSGVEQRIGDQLADLEQKTGRQVVVATVPSLQGYEIEEYGYQLGRAWGIGSKEQNDGVILLVAPQEHKVRIEVGYGLEPVLTDALSNVILQTRVLPKFKAGDLEAGVADGALAIVEQLSLPDDQANARVARVNESPPSRSPGGMPGIAVLIFMIFIFVILSGLFRGRRRQRGGMGGILPWIILGALNNRSSGGGWSGGGGGWSSGGGGGGFSGGGGSFGGGGSSGSW